MPDNGAALNASGMISISGSAESGGATATTGMLNCADGGAPYAESNISSAYKTNTSLTTINQLFNSADFTNGASYNASAPHSMQECYGNQDTSGGGGR